MVGKKLTKLTLVSDAEATFAGVIGAARRPPDGPGGGLHAADAREFGDERALDRRRPAPRPLSHGLPRRKFGDGNALGRRFEGVMWFLLHNRIG